MAGTSGAGKTTVSARIATLLGIEHVEVDGLDWTPHEQFCADVKAFSSQPRWVTEWQCSAVRDLLADEADLLVLLDLPRRTVMRQIMVRTVQRRFRREVLWNGNIEQPFHTFSVDRNHIVRWAWNTHHESAVRVMALSNRRANLTVLRLKNHSEIERWIAGPVRSAAHF